MPKLFALIDVDLLKAFSVAYSSFFDLFIGKFCRLNWVIKLEDLS